MLPSFVQTLLSRCGGVASGMSSSSSSSRADPRCAETIASKPTTNMMAFGGARPRGDAKRDTAAGAAAAGAPSFWSATTPSRRTARGTTWIAVAKAGGGESDSVLDKTAEFYGNSAPGAVAPKGAEKQDEAAVDYAVKGDWEKSLQLIQAMR